MVNSPDLLVHVVALVVGHGALKVSVVQRANLIRQHLGHLPARDQGPEPIIGVLILDHFHLPKDALNVATHAGTHHQQVVGAG